jgi:hypothetical protein
MKTDPDIPFINQCTAIRIDGKGEYKQYMMDEEFPVLLSASANAGNRLLFGTNAVFLISEEAPRITPEVLDLDALLSSSKRHDSANSSQGDTTAENPLRLGWIVGGIASTVPNTSKPTDSSASPFIFEVHLCANHHQRHRRSH